MLFKKTGSFRTVGVDTFKISGGPTQILIKVGACDPESVLAEQQGEGERAVEHEITLFMTAWTAKCLRDALIRTVDIVEKDFGELTGYRTMGEEILKSES